MSSDPSYHRPTRDEILFESVYLFAQRSTCPRARVGVVIAKDGRIIATGYNSSPSGLPHCDNVGCEMVDGHCTRTVHAEAAVIAFSARHGLPLLGTALYSTFSPCLSCAKLIINAGLTEVHYINSYGDILALNLLENAGVTLFDHPSKQW